MALDGLFLHHIKNEIEQECLLSRVDKIYQISKDELIFILRGKSQNQKLLLSANPQNARIHLTKIKTDNPKNPPMFCMLLRKCLINAQLISVSQLRNDRIIILEFKTTNELLDTVVVSVVIEIMGRYSNIILVDENNKIVDSIKRVSSDMSQIRPILPGMLFEKLPAQQKLSLLCDDIPLIIDSVKNSNQYSLPKALLSSIEGVSPLVCREIANFVTHSNDVPVNNLSVDMLDRLKFILELLKNNILTKKTTPTIIIERVVKNNATVEQQPESALLVGDLSKISTVFEKPVDFSFIDIKQYGNLMLTKNYPSFSQLLDEFYLTRDLKERMKQRSNDLLKLLSNLIDRIVRKISVQKEEILTYQDREILKIKGDLISANLYQLQKGLSFAKLDNFYDADNSTLNVDLNPLLTPAQNASYYYTEFKKASQGEKKLKELIVESENELTYLDSVFDSLARATTEDELDFIRLELSQSGYLKSKKQNSKIKLKLSFLQFTSTDGFKIFVGRNNIQNDRLTFKEASKNDLWLHAKNMAGSHVIIFAEDNDIPDSTIEQAACLAAFYSKGVNAPTVSVDYTKARYVKKIPGAKPGMVTYTNFKTALVVPKSSTSVTLDP